MSLGLRSFAFAVAALVLTAAPTARAATLTVDSSLSALNFEFILSILDIDTGEFVPITSAIAQGDVPDPITNLGGTVTPGFSTGLSAQAAGTIDITEGGGNIQINGSSTTLLDSGLWQPGTLTGGVFDFVAVPADLGAFLDVTDLATQVTVLIDNLLVSFATGSVPLVGDTFSDPSGSITVNGADILGNGVGLVAGPIEYELTSPESATVPIGGTYAGGVLTLPVDAGITLPFEVELSPGVFITLGFTINVDGQLVTNVIPEPSSFALLGMGVVGLVGYGVRRRLSK